MILLGLFCISNPKLSSLFRNVVNALIDGERKYVKLLRFLIEVCNEIIFGTGLKVFVHAFLQFRGCLR